MYLPKIDEFVVKSSTSNYSSLPDVLEAFARASSKLTTFRTVTTTANRAGFDGFAALRQELVLSRYTLSSFWRGVWAVLDETLTPEQSASLYEISYADLNFVLNHLNESEMDEIKKRSWGSRWIRHPAKQPLSEKDSTKLLSYLNYRVSSRKHGLGYLVDYDSSIDLQSIASDAFGVGICAAYRKDDLTDDAAFLYNIAKKAAIYRMETIRQYYHCESRRPVDQEIEEIDYTVNTYKPRSGVVLPFSDLDDFLSQSEKKSNVVKKISYTYKAKLVHSDHPKSFGGGLAASSSVRREIAAESSDSDCSFFSQKDFKRGSFPNSLAFVEIKNVLDTLTEQAQHVCAAILGIGNDPQFEAYLTSMVRDPNVTSEKALFKHACHYYGCSPDRVRAELSKAMSVTLPEAPTRRSRYHHTDSVR